MSGSNARDTHMNRASGYFIGSLALIAAATLSPIVDGYFTSARSETFDARWVALDANAKQDRLAAPRKVAEAQVVAISDPSSRTTTLTKTESPASTKGTASRESARDTARKQKLPVGCDPSFSPVAMPAMAHVTGRCLVERQTGNKFAELSR